MGTWIANSLRACTLGASSSVWASTNILARDEMGVQHGLCRGASTAGLTICGSRLHPAAQTTSPTLVPALMGRLGNCQVNHVGRTNPVYEWED